jgi:polyphosphate kinase
MMETFRNTVVSLLSKLGLHSGEGIDALEKGLRPWGGEGAERPVNEGQLYRNRELSWLKFNERVLEEAEDPKVPLCERLNFASIYQSNLDEFFMVRVGSLVDQRLVSEDLRDNKTQMTAQEQLTAVLAEVGRLGEKKDAAVKELLRELEEQGACLTSFGKLGKQEKAYLERYFTGEIAPLISPTMVGKRQPFPFLRNKEIYAVAVLGGKGSRKKLGLIPCGTDVIPRLIPIPGREGTYMLSEELILHFIPKVFKGYPVEAKSLLRVTRNADIDADALYDEDLDYREFMADLMKKRRRLAPVRMELSRRLDPETVELLCRYTKVDPAHVFRSRTPLDLSFFSGIQDSLRQNPQLFYEKRIPQRAADFRPGESVLAQIRERDRLLYYPYESMASFLQMLREAATDPAVISIKMTLYRVAQQSKIVEALIEAAENGKEVLVLVELKARFDEENNIEWSRRLEAAGCQVIYGLSGYKVHSKLCLITRRTAEHTEYYTQVGTGNYNEKTARLYTDYCLMTANQAIGLEASAVFQALAMGETVDEMELLVLAPNCLQDHILEKIDREIEYARRGEPAYVGAKLNSLTDKAIIDRLIEASRAGVKIELIIRGICCMLPGVPGATENIRVISIVGRYLEHSRVYLFGTPERRSVYLSSADWMTRNTLRRVEVAAPVLDPSIRQRLEEDFSIMLRDNVQARQLLPDGNYAPVENGEEPLSAQEYFYQRAYRLATAEDAPEAEAEKS